MRIVAFITDRAVIDRILDHLRRKREGAAQARGPPATARVALGPRMKSDPAATVQA